MWTVAGIARTLRKRVLHVAERPLEEAACKSWEICPGRTLTMPPAVCLPNQIERITGWPFAHAHPKRELVGGMVEEHRPTRGYLVKGAVLIDGTLSKGRYSRFLKLKARKLPHLKLAHEVDRGAIYSTAGGTRWFGMWLTDDCVLHPLAVSEGQLISLGPPQGPHLLPYKERLGIRPRNVGSAYFHEAVFFDDYGMTENRRRRMVAMGEKLRSKVDWRAHPGVFLLRGEAGERRFLTNELEIAEMFRVRRGFKVIDPMRSDVDTITAACAGARVLAGVEGSQLAHGLCHLSAGGAMLTLQPPNRFVTFYKPYVEVLGAKFAFVTGLPESKDFHIEPDEVERTLDLLDAPENKVDVPVMATAGA